MIMKKMAIFLDYRERELHSFFQDSPYVTVKPIDVGDVWIGISGEDITEGGLIIERKTISDLESSLLDGRYREQRTRLLAYASSHKAKVLYMIEGPLDGHRPYGKKSKAELQQVLNRLMLKYNIAVYNTKNIEDSANYINVLYKQYSEDPKVFQGEILSYTDVQQFTKKGNKENPHVFACAALQQCPGISAKIAEALLQAFGSLEQIFAQTPEALAAVKVNNRKVGVAAQRLYNLLHNINASS